jgi:hypothetical protein
VKPLHLARRFFRALWPSRPRSADVGWVTTVLTREELALWNRLPNHDRRYSIRMARKVDELLAATMYAGDPRWAAIALLHDVGKLDAHLGIPGRVAATLAGAVAPSARGGRGRFGRYLRHGEIGARLIRAVGGREDAARWAAAHHHPDRWPETGIPGPVATALAAADDA